MLLARRRELRRGKMLSFLDGLKEADDAARSLYIPAGLSSQRIGDLMENVDPENTAPDIPALAAASRTGAVVFWSPSQRYLVAPPFPIAEEGVSRGFAVKPLVSLLSQDFQIALVLVRLGSYAIGLCQGEKLIASKVGTGNIHSRHRQGGSSQKRFQRHREKQIESFLIRACGHIQDILGREARSVDYVVYGGAQTTILLLQKRCPFLEQFDNRTLPALLDIMEPRQPVLEGAIGRVWSSRVIEWYDDTSSDQRAESSP